jgi:HD-GYP domain-containing protein (c-di-GMP phosphodiesterase class II)
MSDLYYPIRINTIRQNGPVSFDLFIKIGDRYVHYSRSNEEVESARLANLKANGMRKLFIPSEAEASYLEYLEAGLHVLKKDDVSLTDRASLAYDSFVTCADNAEKSLESEAGFQKQKDQMNMISEFLQGNQKALKEVLNSAGISTDESTHSATVSSLSIGLGNHLNLSNEELFELGTAALLHDIGKSRLKFDHRKAFTQMSEEEKKSYKNHPQDGADMLAGKPFISPRILGLVASHEERGLGRGYPEKKDISKLSISYQILSLANMFDHFCIEKNLTAVRAIDGFYEGYEKDYSDELFATLATILA